MNETELALTGEPLKRVETYYRGYIGKRGLCTFTRDRSTIIGIPDVCTGLSVLSVSLSLILSLSFSLSHSLSLILSLSFSLTLTLTLTFTLTLAGGA